MRWMRRTFTRVSGSRYNPARWSTTESPGMSALWHRRLRRKGFALSDPLQVNVFRDQLNRLIDTHPKKLTNGTVVKGLAERGCVISPPYLSQLRTGARTNPSREVVDALASFFDVPRGISSSSPTR